MGYGSRRNEKMIVRMVKMYLGDGEISRFIQLYRHMNTINLDAKERKKLLLLTCRNGWQHFVRFVVKHEFE